MKIAAALTLATFSFSAARIASAQEDRWAGDRKVTVRPSEALSFGVCPATGAFMRSAAVTEGRRVSLRSWLLASSCRAMISRLNKRMSSPRRRTRSTAERRRRSSLGITPAPGSAVNSAPSMSAVSVECWRL